MCKLYVVTGPLNRRQTEAAIWEANRAFCRTERDGFGFIAANGATVARGRYLEPARFPGYMAKLPHWFSGPAVEENVLPKVTTALVVHGRTSTNVKSLENCHPFKLGELYLAHNGVLYWEGAYRDQPSPSCDSERFLHWFAGERSWDGAGKFWSGWGAIALYNAQTGALTVAQGGASLYVARRAGGVGWVFATCREHLVKVSRKAKIGLDSPPVSVPTKLLTFQGGAMVGEADWTGFTRRTAVTTMDLLARGKSAGNERTNRCEMTERDQIEAELDLAFERERFPDYVPGGNSPW
jgi:hypothetical protein